jgi:hypothetical protein
LIPKFASEVPQGFANFGIGTLERDDFSKRNHHALAFRRSIIFSENRYPGSFGIMLSLGFVERYN